MPCSCLSNGSVFWWFSIWRLTKEYRLNKRTYLINVVYQLYYFICFHGWNLFGSLISLSEFKNTAFCQTRTHTQTLTNYRCIKFSFIKSRMNLTQKHCKCYETMTRQFLTASDKIILCWEWELNFNAEAIYQPLRFGWGNEFQFRRLSHCTKHKLINSVLSLALFVCVLVFLWLFFSVAIIYRLNSHIYSLQTNDFHLHRKYKAERSCTIQ